jgi:hypothetical protein
MSWNHHRHGALRRTFFTLCLLALSAPREVAAGPSEESLKAAMVYNFAKFVEWPAGASGALTFCIVGNDALAESLVAILDGKTVGGRPTRVFAGMQFAQKECAVVFLASKLGNRTLELLKQASGPGVLTVGDAAGFSEMGGVFEVFLDSKRLRFFVNQPAAFEAGLHVSARVLKLSTAPPERKGDR